MPPAPIPPFSVSVCFDRSHALYDAHEALAGIEGGTFAVDGRPVALHDLVARGCPIYANYHNTRTLLIETARAWGVPPPPRYRLHMPHPPWRHAPPPPAPPPSASDA